MQFCLALFRLDVVHLMLEITFSYMRIAVICKFWDFLFTTVRPQLKPGVGLDFSVLDLLVYVAY